MADLEEPLSGGNVAAAVVRVGGTVRKPWRSSSAGVHLLLGHLAAGGVAGAPRAVGRDEDGRQVLEFVEGKTAHTGVPLDRAGLARVGSLIRELHDASATFIPPAGAAWEVAIPADCTELWCHHDLAPWNLVCGPQRWAFIDWDGAGPGSRLWDLAYAVQSFVPLQAGVDPTAAGGRVRVLVDAYGLTAEQRRELSSLLEPRTRGMYELLAEGARTGQQPWARLFTAGHGAYWESAADYIAANLGELRLWLTA